MLKKRAEIHHVPKNGDLCVHNWISDPKPRKTTDATAPTLRLQFGREEFRCENIESFKTVLSEEL